MPFERILDPLHDCKYLLLLQPPPHNLHTNRQPSHFRSIVMLVRALSHTIQLLEVERSGQLIPCWVDVSHRQDAGSVVQLRQC
jgi:hypothetical protein